MYIKSMKKILVVDDDPDILESLKILLEDEGYKVSVAEDPQSLVNKTSSQDELPDVILLDIFISGHDGRQLARQLKKMPQTKNIPIIMISAHPYALHTAKDYGADDMLPKPFDIEKLLTKVQTNIQKSIN